MAVVEPVVEADATAAFNATRDVLCSSVLLLFLSDLCFDSLVGVVRAIESLE